MAKIVREGVVKNLFLDLLQLRRFDTATSWKTKLLTKNACFFGNGWIFSNIRYHNGVKQFFQDATLHTLHYTFHTFILETIILICVLNI